MILFSCQNKACNFEQYFLDEDDPDICPVCDSKWYRITFCKDKVRGHGWYPGKNKERWSTSMGVPANQVKQFSERFPNSTYSPDGRLLIKNRADKKRQMAERGFIEHK